LSLPAVAPSRREAYSIAEKKTPAKWPGRIAAVSVVSRDR
jgi:hypothetical protein